MSTNKAAALKYLSDVHGPYLATKYYCQDHWKNLASPCEIFVYEDIACNRLEVVLVDGKNKWCVKLIQEFFYNSSQAQIINFILNEFSEAGVPSDCLIMFQDQLNCKLFHNSHQSSEHKKTGSSIFFEKSWSLPGASVMTKHPLTGKMGNLHQIIMNLNDVVGWSREKIADWLDTLDEDLSFNE